MDKASLTLTISCPDAVGLIAAVSGFLSENQAFITESSQYGDPVSNTFFMRSVFKLDAAHGNRQNAKAELEKKFTKLASRFHMTWKIHDNETRARVVLMVSKLGHCLNDLLHRVQVGTLPIDIPAVVSNHEDFRDLVEWHRIPFHYIPVTSATKSQAEATLIQLLKEVDPDLVVLARYMQVLSPELCRHVSGRCINIHHSFLPSFKGAKPYHQAHQRGVKLIGATAHYVTDSLDEGPIIDQSVERVDHTFDPERLTAVGRDIENVVLARAVLYHIEHRILPNGNKTIVFK
jgi:formyltetrahydrofolate deformylase